LGVLAQHSGYVYFDSEEPPRSVGQQIKDVIFYRSVFLALNNNDKQPVPFNKLIGSDIVFKNGFEENKQIVTPLTFLSKKKCRELMAILTLFCKAYVDFSSGLFSETIKNNMYTYFSIHQKRFNKVLYAKRDTYETFV
jgi:hypothetical protein